VLAYLIYENKHVALVHPVTTLPRHSAMTFSLPSYRVTPSASLTNIAF
jgi:hypothetical protein